MPGGLIQVSKYGSKNLFLTGNPEITFFKAVYKRYTNFAAETFSLKFNNGINFDQISTIEIPSNGDLLYKMYLELNLPEIHLDNLIKENENIDLDISVDLKRYEAIKRWIKLNLTAYRNAYNQFLPENIVTSETILNEIRNTFNDTNLAENPVFTENDPYLYFNPNPEDTDPKSESFQNNYDEVLFLTKKQYELNFIEDNSTNPKYENSYSNSIFYDAQQYGITKSQELINSTHIRYVFDYFDSIDSKYEVIEFLDEILLNLEELDKFWSDTIKNIKENLDLNYNKIKFSWVDNLGTSLIDYIEIEINGMVIDRQYGMWLDIWNELTLDKKKIKTYNIMNGNVKELTTFDKNIKPSYNLIIPLNFWFNKTNGVAFPLVSLRDQNIKLNVKFRKFSEVCYIEKESIIKIKYSDNQNFNLDDLVNEDIVKLDGSLNCDYIFLDENERILFAQSTHDYLIEQINLEVFREIDDKNLMVNLEFTDPVKELIWILQDDKYITKLDDSTKLEWNKYEINDKNPINKSELLFNDWTRTMNMDYKYYNYIQPLLYHTKTPKKGINVYSFSLKPEEYQPSGHCSMKYITDKRMKFEINEDVFLDNNKATLYVFGISYNVLRIKNGTANLIFV